MGFFFLCLISESSPVAEVVNDLVLLPDDYVPN